MGIETKTGMTGDRDPALSAATYNSPREGIRKNIELSTTIPALRMRVATGEPFHKKPRSVVSFLKVSGHTVFSCVARTSSEIILDLFISFTPLFPPCATPAVGP
jgi:hypothetical protein